jgi:hypothetical protein
VRRSRPATILSPRELSALDYRANNFSFLSSFARIYPGYTRPIEVAFRELFGSRSFYFALPFCLVFIALAFFYLGLGIGIGIERTGFTGNGLARKRIWANVYYYYYPREREIQTGERDRRI